MSPLPAADVLCATGCRSRWVVVGDRSLTAHAGSRPTGPRRTRILPLVTYTATPWNAASQAVPCPTSSESAISSGDALRRVFALVHRSASLPCRWEGGWFLMRINVSSGSSTCMSSRWQPRSSRSMRQAGIAARVCLRRVRCCAGGEWINTGGWLPPMAACARSAPRRTNLMLRKRTLPMGGARVPGRSHHRRSRTHARPSVAQVVPQRRRVDCQTRGNRNDHYLKEYSTPLAFSRRTDPFPCLYWHARANLFSLRRVGHADLCPHQVALCWIAADSSAWAEMSVGAISLKRLRGPSLAVGRRPSHPTYRPCLEA